MFIPVTEQAPPEDPFCGPNFFGDFFFFFFSFFSRRAVLIISFVSLLFFLNRPAWLRRVSLPFLLDCFFHSLFSWAIIFSTPRRFRATSSITFLSFFVSTLQVPTQQLNPFLLGFFCFFDHLPPFFFSDRSSPFRLGDLPLKSFPLFYFNFRLHLSHAASSWSLLFPSVFSHPFFNGFTFFISIRFAIRRSAASLVGNEWFLIPFARCWFCLFRFFFFHRFFFFFSSGYFTMTPPLWLRNSFLKTLFSADALIWVIYPLEPKERLDFWFFLVVTCFLGVLFLPVAKFSLWARLVSLFASFRFVARLRGSPLRRKYFSFLFFSFFLWYFFFP